MTSEHSLLMYARDERIYQPGVGLSPHAQASAAAFRALQAALATASPFFLIRSRSSGLIGPRGPRGASFFSTFLLIAETSTNCARKRQLARREPGAFSG